MKTKDAIKSLWRECFDDSDQYVDMFFSIVYRDDDALVLEREGHVVSGMLLQRYVMNFHDIALPVSYICGAATTRTMRGHGYMADLMGEAVNESLQRGDVFVTLIPAHDWLYHYYGRFGFSPAFYVETERYTSAHVFRPQGEYMRYVDLNSEEAYGFFNAMMMTRNCCIQHTRRQYDEILMDNSVDGGEVIAVSDENGIAAMAFAAPGDDGAVVVKDILAATEDARTAALAAVSETFAGMPVTVLGYYDRYDGTEETRGMIRIVNVASCLGAIARAYPDIKTAIKVRDRILPDNNATFVMSGGECRVDNGYAGKIDYDVDIEVLTSIVFGNDVTRRLLNFPAVRPFISLMLD